MNNQGKFEKFDKSFLQGLSLYIDDMRLLKNIYNEFVIYYNRLNITELDCNKMLAIIAYPKRNPEREKRGYPSSQKLLSAMSAFRICTN